MPVEFEGGNSRYTLGVEEELCIVDAETGELVPKIEEVMARLPGRPLRVRLLRALPIGP